MNTIEQAREVAERLRNHDTCISDKKAADTIDALITKLKVEREDNELHQARAYKAEAELAALKGQEPVMYQARTSPNWTNGVWTKWEECSVGQAKDYKKCPLLNDWKYEARALHLAAGAQPYDQQALEPCEACGWKAIIPGERCLVCERNEMPAAGARIIPAGYQLVRIEPTDQMLEMGSIATDYDYSQERIKRVWQQMLMAAAREQVSQQFGNESHFTTRQERAKPVQREPLFWYRPCSDGGYEGPISNGSIEDVRKRSGAWIPLVAAPVQAGAQAQAQERKPKCVARIEVFGKDWRLDYLSLPVGKHDLYAQEYTHDAQERKPLTDEQIYSITGVADRDEMMHRMARNIARAIEQAHGIKEQP